ncbi:MAG: hypothetical protein RL011_2219, partial [Pseudomonadota bacterium]
MVVRRCPLNYDPTFISKMIANVFDQDIKVISFTASETKVD